MHDVQYPQQAPYTCTWLSKRCDRCSQRLYGLFFDSVAYHGIIDAEATRCKRGVFLPKWDNKYLSKYIEKHNKKFAIEAEQKDNAHREKKPEEELEKILCYKEERTISKNLEVSYGGRILQIKEEKEINRLRRSKLMVIEKLDGKIQLLYQGRELKYYELPVKDRQGKILDRKGVLGKRSVA